MDDAQQFLDYALELEPSNYELIKKVMMVYLSVGKPQIVLDTLATLNVTENESTEMKYIRAKAYLKLWVGKLHKGNKKRLPCG
jgi:hypothetical protein